MFVNEQVHPKKGRGEMLAEDVAWFLPVASNEATKEVSMIVKCGDVQFFTKWSDPCVKIAKQEYMFLLPADAIGIEIRDVAAEVVTQFDTMLAQKTEFSEDDDTDSLLREDEFSKEERKMLYPDDGTSQKIMEMTGWLTHRILKVSAATAEKVGWKRKLPRLSFSCRFSIVISSLYLLLCLLCSSFVL